MCRENHNKVVAAVCLLVTSHSASALEWHRERGLDIGLSYSDNLFFSETDSAESGPIINFTPYLGLLGVGRNSQFSLSAEGRYQNLPEQNIDSFVPELEADLDLDLIEDMISTGLAISVSRVETADEIVFEDSSIVSSDTSNRYTGIFNTSFNYDFGGQSNLWLDHAFSLIENESELRDDSNNHTTRFRWSEVPGEEQPGWRLEGRHQSTEFAQQEGRAEISALSAAFGLFTNTDWLLTGRIGNEWVGSTADEEASRNDTWSLTLAWRPNSQSTLEFGYGKRSFGSNPTFEYTYAGRRFDFSAHWRRNYANTRVIASSDETTDDGDIIDPDDQIITSGVPEHLLGNSRLFVDDDIGMEIVYRGRLSEVSLEGTYLLRENQVDGSEVENALITAAFNRRLNSATRWELSYTYRERLRSADVESTFENRVNLSLQYFR